MRPYQRALSAEENKALKMLEQLEALIDRKKTFGDFIMSEDAWDLFSAVGVAQPLSVERDRSSNAFRVRFEPVELWKYLDFICEHIGMEVQIDGTVKTKDGMVIPIPFKASPPLLINSKG